MSRQIGWSGLVSNVNTLHEKVSQVTLRSEFNVRFLSLSPEAVANRNVEFGTLDLKPIRRLARHGLVIVVSVIIMKLAQKGEEYVTTRKV